MVKAFEQSISFLKSSSEQEKTAKGTILFIIIIIVDGDSSGGAATNQRRHMSIFTPLLNVFFSPLQLQVCMAALIPMKSSSLTGKKRWISQKKKET